MRDDSYGSGYGGGYGYGYGDGDGYGYGDGDGYGYGGGSGYGDGYGDGYGYGDGDGYGDDGGEKLGKIGAYSVRHLVPWQYVSIGCQTHSVAWWRANWRTLARKEELSVSQSEVEEMLCKATSYAAGQMDEL